MNGILIVDKPKNLTSRDVVNETSKILKTKKIGHTGTLDPIATGVLVLTVNKATKISELLTNYDKKYVAEVILGIKTDTLDVTGQIIENKKAIIDKKDIELALNKMIGKYNQEVPIYSAVKIKGKKLYEYARENKKITLPKREVVIKSLDLIGDIKYENDTTIFKFQCLVSKGTYIRSLINDIANNLNTIGTMKNLRRIKQGQFEIEESIKLEEIAEDKIIPLKECLKNYYQVEVDETLYNKIKNGQIIDNVYHHDEVVFIYDNKVIAIYKKDNNKLKPWKMLISANDGL